MAGLSVLIFLCVVVRHIVHVVRFKARAARHHKDEQRRGAGRATRLRDGATKTAARGSTVGAGAGADGTTNANTATLNGGETKNTDAPSAYSFAGPAAVTSATAPVATSSEDVSTAGVCLRLLLVDKSSTGTGVWDREVAQTTQLAFRTTINEMVDQFCVMAKATETVLEESRKLHEIEEPGPLERKLDSLVSSGLVLIADGPGGKVIYPSNKAHSTKLVTLFQRGDTVGGGAFACWSDVQNSGEVQLCLEIDTEKAPETLDELLALPHIAATSRKDGDLPPLRIWANVQFDRDLNRRLKDAEEYVEQQHPYDALGILMVLLCFAAGGVPLIFVEIPANSFSIWVICVGSVSFLCLVGVDACKYRERRFLSNRKRIKQSGQEDTTYLNKNRRCCQQQHKRQCFHVTTFEAQHCQTYVKPILGILTLVHLTSLVSFLETPFTASFLLASGASLTVTNAPECDIRITQSDTLIDNIAVRISSTVSGV
jgi:hypothetical protein